MASIHERFHVKRHADLVMLDLGPTGVSRIRHGGAQVPGDVRDQTIFLEITSTLHDRGMICVALGRSMPAGIAFQGPMTLQKTPTDRAFNAVNLDDEAIPTRVIRDWSDPE